jgi:hypothetical protein
MTSPIGPVSGYNMESLLTDRTATQAQQMQKVGPMVEQVVGKTDRPLDKVEFKTDHLLDMRQLKAVGPGVPLFKNSDAPVVEPTGRNTEPNQYNSSGKTLLVDAFG